MGVFVLLVEENNMAFENVKIVDPYVEKGWTPEIKLTLTTPEEVAAVEAKLNLTFPEGYKDHQEFLDEYWFWEDGEDLLPKKKAIECIKICGDDVGDVVIFHPSNPKELFALPHEDDFSHKIGSNLYEAFDWLVAQGSKAAGGTEESLKRRMFVPDNPLQYGNEVIRPEGFYE